MTLSDRKHFQNFEKNPKTGQCLAGQCLAGQCFADYCTRCNLLHLLMTYK